jgi:predicted DNA-binding transcriptional regulator AlpA
MTHIDRTLVRQIAQPVAAALPESATRSARVVPVLLTEDEAAAVLGVSKRTFLNLRSESWMPLPIVLGPRMHRYSIDELRAAVSNMPRQTQRTQPESLLRNRIERAKATGDMR